MPSLRDRKFEELATAVERAVCWQLGVGHEWECECIIDADTLGDLVRLAFEAPEADRGAFLASLKASEPA